MTNKEMFEALNITDSRELHFTVEFHKIMPDHNYVGYFMGNDNTDFNVAIVSLSSVKKFEYVSSGFKIISDQLLHQ